MLQVFPALNHSLPQVSYFQVLLPSMCDLVLPSNISFCCYTKMSCVLDYTCSLPKFEPFIVSNFCICSNISLYFFNLSFFCTQYHFLFSFSCYSFHTCKSCCFLEPQLVFFSFFFFFRDKDSCSPGIAQEWPRTHHEADIDLELLIFLPPPA